MRVYSSYSLFAVDELFQEKIIDQDSLDGSCPGLERTLLDGEHLQDWVPQNR